MYSVTLSVRINAPKSTVWEAMSEFDSVSKWTRSVSESYFVSTQTEGIGTERACKVPRFGLVKEKITYWEPLKGLSYEANTAITKYARSHWRISSDGEDTIVTVSPEFEVRFGFLGRLMETFLLKPQLNKQIPEVLAEFKYYVENQEAINENTMEKLPLASVFQ